LRLAIPRYRYFYHICVLRLEQDIVPFRFGLDSEFLLRRVLGLHDLALTNRHALNDLFLRKAPRGAHTQRHGNSEHNAKHEPSPSPHVFSLPAIRHA
jgi:hypothetical protein